MPTADEILTIWNHSNGQCECQSPVHVNSGGRCLEQVLFPLYNQNVPTGWYMVEITPPGPAAEPSSRVYCRECYFKHQPN